MGELKIIHTVSMESLIEALSRIFDLRSFEAAFLEHLCTDEALSNADARVPKRGVRGEGK